MKSHDLVNWKIVNYAFDVLDESDACSLRNGADAYGKGSWAASIRYNNGTYYITVASFTTGITYISQTEDIENGTWRRYEINRVFHDQSLLFDDDGRVYLVHGGGRINIIELTGDASAVKPDGLDKVIIEEADVGGKGGLPAEGAHFYKINGRYYLFLIAWPTDGTSRRIQLCYRSERVDGPYEGRVILDDDIGFKNNGVAQGGIFDTPNGDWYAMLFQDHGAVGRIPVLVPLVWTDGWPVLGNNGKVPKQLDLPDIDLNFKGIVDSDEFYQDSVTAKLSPVWQWNHNPDHSLWSLTERTGYLRLKSDCLCQSFTYARNTLTQRTFGPVCAGTATLDTSGMNDGDFAGLGALQYMYGFVGVKAVNGIKYAVMVNASSGAAEEVEAVPFTGDMIYFRIDFDFRDAADRAYFYYSHDEIVWRQIGNRLDMQYKLIHFTGYRFALFYYSTKNIGGYADFDYFRLSDKLMTLHSIQT
jgi:beta-xylosidase